jgi:hypothetical protein
MSYQYPPCPPSPLSLPALHGDFLCPVCRGRRYGAVHVKLHAAPYQTTLYRCLNCRFGFTELDQFVKGVAAEVGEST